MTARVASKLPSEGQNGLLLWYWYSDLRDGQVLLLGWFLMARLV
jgi:hypothetical protein